MRGERHGQCLRPLPAAPAVSLLGRSAATAASRLSAAARFRRAPGKEQRGTAAGRPPPHEAVRLLHALSADSSAGRRQRRHHHPSIGTGSLPGLSPPPSVRGNDAVVEPWGRNEEAPPLWSAGEEGERGGGRRARHRCWQLPSLPPWESRWPLPLPSSRGLKWERAAHKMAPGG